MATGARSIAGRCSTSGQLLRRVRERHGVPGGGEYKRKAGGWPPASPSLVGGVYRLPPVVFAIQAPPGRDRFLGALEIQRAWSLISLFVGAAQSLVRR